MGATISWIWAATIAQLWTGTTLVGKPTTVFVRRTLLWLVPGFLLMRATLADVDGVSGALALLYALLLTPAGAIMAMAGWVFFMGMLRIATLPMAAFPILLSWPFRLMFWFADLTWRLEAGPGPAAAQAAKTRHAVAEAERSNLRSELQHRVTYGMTRGARYAPGSLTLHTSRGPVTATDVRVSAGVLLGRVDGDEVPVGSIRSTGGAGFELLDANDQVFARVDHSGKDERGAVLLVPDDASLWRSGTSEREWAEAMEDGPAPRSRLSVGPMAHTVGVATGMALSLLAFFNFDQLPQWSPGEDDADVAEAQRPDPDAGVPAASVVRSEADPVEVWPVGVSPATIPWERPGHARPYDTAETFVFRGWTPEGQAGWEVRDPMEPGYCSERGDFFVAEPGKVVATRHFERDRDMDTEGCTAPDPLVVMAKEGPAWFAEQGVSVAGGLGGPQPVVKTLGGPEVDGHFARYRLTWGREEQVGGEGLALSWSVLQSFVGPTGRVAVLLTSRESGFEGTVHQGYTMVVLEPPPRGQLAEEGAGPLVAVAAEASSHLEEPGFDHTASRAVDGLPYWAWQEGAEGWGEGESLTLRFACTEELHHLGVHPGHYNRSASWSGNGRVKQADIAVRSLAGETLVERRAVFTDKEGVEQRVDLGARCDGAVDVVFTIREVTPGTGKATDTCVGEVFAYGR